MKIILKADVANLGYKDDVVEVKNGYARNYLIPQRLAIMATSSALKVHAENLKQRAHKIETFRLQRSWLSLATKSTVNSSLSRRALRKWATTRPL